jgi:hypothetical protein
MRQRNARIRAIRLVNLLLVTAIHVEPVHGTAQVSNVNVLIYRINLQPNRLVEMPG